MKTKTAAIIAFSVSLALGGLSYSLNHKSVGYNPVTTEGAIAGKIAYFIPVLVFIGIPVYLCCKGLKWPLFAMIATILTTSVSMIVFPIIIFVYPVIALLIVGAGVWTHYSKYRKQTAAEQSFLERHEPRFE